MAMLPWQSRLAESATQSVENLAKVEEIGNPPKIAQDAVIGEG